MVSKELENLIGRGYEPVGQDGRIAIYGFKNLGLVYDKITDIILFEFDMDYKMKEKITRNKNWKKHKDNCYEDKIRGKKL